VIVISPHDMWKLCASGRHLSTNAKSSVRSRWKSVSMTTYPNLACLKNRINISGEAIMWLFCRACRILGL
ncbi:hypothetical protein PIB30_095338, partial [Stylosanthes scabra]|nr:hypothetical protein [Stylosanthes scabra]